MIHLLAEDAQALDCVTEVENARDILRRGTSAERQRVVFTEAMKEHGNEERALKQVVQMLVEQFCG